MILAAFASVFAQSGSKEPEVVITLFWRDGCSHCAAEKPYLQELAKQYPQIKIKAYEVSVNSSNRDYMDALGSTMGFDTDAVPVTVIGDHSWLGFDDSVSSIIQAAVQSCMTTGCPDPADKYGIDTSKTTSSLEVTESKPGIGITWWVIIAIGVVVASYGLGDAAQ
jgi:thiol-disulfide isomerase/thioredoxin